MNHFSGTTLCEYDVLSKFWRRISPHLGDFGAFVCVGRGEMIAHAGCSEDEWRSFLGGLELLVKAMARAASLPVDDQVTFGRRMRQLVCEELAGTLVEFQEYQSFSGNVEWDPVDDDVPF